MEKILLFQISEENAAQIQKLASPMKIKVHQVPKDAYGEAIGKIADNRISGKANAAEEILLPQSLILFCDLTEKHLDKILAGLKREQIMVDFKAVLTSTNRNWTIQKLYLEMIRERASIEKGLQ